MKTRKLPIKSWINKLIWQMNTLKKQKKDWKILKMLEAM